MADTEWKIQERPAERTLYCTSDGGAHLAVFSPWSHAPGEWRWSVSFTVAGVEAKTSGAAVSEEVAVARALAVAADVVALAKKGSA
jgi:hypothetical protein